ncbi:MAG TPA: T9SS type A sorting domain-containing protein, partial [Bacteroidia bacterium]|nr:T9SS type A sorting domain-containing protein [Bacteroidia bacterium]
TPSGGLTPYTFSWSNGETNATATGLTAGIYTVTVSNNGGCSATASVTLTQSAQVVGPEATVTKNVTCNGGANASAVSTPVGGTAPYTYTWQGGTTTSVISGLSAGTYTITVTDHNGHTGTGSVTINQPAPVIPYVVVDANVTIYNGNDGDATVYITGGTIPYAYNWDDGETTLNAGHLTAGTHTITVSDSAGCSGTASFIITQPAPVCTSWWPVGNAGFSASYTEFNSITTDASGNPYMCYYDGSVFGKASVMKFNGTTWQLVGTAGFSAGQVEYTSIAIDGSGTPYVAYQDDYNSSGVTVMKYSGGSWQVVGTTNLSSGQANFISLAIDGSGTPYVAYQDVNNSYAATVMKFSSGSWQPVGTVGFSAGQADNTSIVIDGSGTPYIAYCDYGNFRYCTVMKFISGSWQPVGSVGFSPNQVQYTDIALSSTGTPYVVFSDANSGNEATVMKYSSGSWSIVGTEGFSQGLPYGESITIDNSGTPYISYINLNNYFGYVMKYISGSWQTVGSSAISAGETSYLTVKSDASGNVYAGFEDYYSGRLATVERYGTFDANATLNSNITCYGNNNGNATAYPSGGTSPFTYLWDNGETTQVASTLSAGVHTVTVSDHQTCSAVATVTITQPGAFLVNATVTSNVGCFGGNSGGATTSISGGTSPFTYLWSDSKTTGTISNLSANTFSVTVNDAGGCSATSSVTITQPTQFQYISAGIMSHVSCNGANNGKVTVTPVGGSLPYTYAWVNAAHTIVSTLQSTPSTLSAGTYTVTVKDNCGVSFTASVVVTQPAGLHSGISSVTDVGCNGGNGGKATATATGGTYPYSYSWSNGNTLVTASGLSAGTYTVTVTDKNGCSATNAAPVATITQPNVLAESLQNITYPTCNGQKGSATVSVTGGTSPYIYTWTSGLSTTATCTKLTAGSYTVSVKDKNSCTVSLVVTMTQPAAIRDTIVSSSKVNVLCNGSSTGSATVGVKYGASPYTYAWSPNVSSSATANGLSAGIYSITVTDHSGCSSSVAKVTITQPGDLRDSIKPWTCSDNMVTATVGVKGGVSPYSYAWSPGGGTKATMSSLVPGTYTVTVTDKNHCSNTITTALTCPPEAPHDGEDKGTAPQCCTGTDNITLYPNPNSGQFTIQSSAGSGQLSVEIYNMLGEKLYLQLSTFNSQLSIDISSQPNGIYLIRILNKDGTLVSQKKVVKTN